MFNESNLFFLVTGKKLHLASSETPGENDGVQDIITSLTLQLQERDKQIEKLKQNLRGSCNYLLLIVCMALLIITSSIITFNSSNP